MGKKMNAKRVEVVAIGIFQWEKAIRRKTRLFIFVLVNFLAKKKKKRKVETYLE